MRGQLGLDVMVTMIIFIAFVGFLFFQLLALRPGYLQAIGAEKIRAEAYHTAEMLIDDPGEPVNWNELDNIGDIKRIGLSDTSYNLTNLISWKKVERLQSICCPAGLGQPCSGYDEVRKKIGAEEQQFIIAVSGNGLSAICIPPPEMVRIGILNFTVKRAVAINSSGQVVPGSVTVRMWG